MHTVANTFSTTAVKTASMVLKTDKIIVKVDPGDRDLYRRAVTAPDLVTFRVTVKETDLLVLADHDVTDRVRDSVMTHRDRLERFIASNPDFLASLEPVTVPATAPAIVHAMAEAGRTAGVGPMAAVAGAVCEAVARDLGEGVRELILENGGDLYIRTTRERTVGIFAGKGEGRMTVGLRVRPESTPLGICTSSGRIGHSLSFGDSAAATVIARSAALADAAATAVGNRVRGTDGIRRGLETARGIPGVLGAVVIRDGRLGAWGEVELVGLQEPA
jgi:hypothetical protein